jgi:hypothetical protein
MKSGSLVPWRNNWRLLNKNLQSYENLNQYTEDSLNDHVIMIVIPLARSQLHVCRPLGGVMATGQRSSRVREG